MTPYDRMDESAYPWPKAYNYTLLDLLASYYSFYAPAAAVNFGTHALYNASPGDRLLVVLAFNLTGSTTASRLGIATLQGRFGAHLGAENPVWAGMSAGAGQHWYADQAAQIGDTLVQNPATSYTSVLLTARPLAVLPPGWSFVLQANAIALTTAVSFAWEELRIDDPRLGAIGARV